MDDSKKAWRWLSKATQRKEQDDLSGAINLVKKADTLLQLHSPSERREIITKLAFYHRISGDYDAMMITLLQGYMDAIDSDDYEMKVMEASILISRLSHHLKKIAKDKEVPDFFGSKGRKQRAANQLISLADLCDLESQKLLIVARAVQGLLKKMHQLVPTVLETEEAMKFAEENAWHLSRLNNINPRSPVYGEKRNYKIDKPVDLLVDKITKNLERVMPRIWQSELMCLWGAKQKVIRAPRKRRGWQNVHLSSLSTVYFSPTDNPWLNSPRLNSLKEAWIQELSHISPNYKKLAQILGAMEQSFRVAFDDVLVDSYGNDREQYNLFETPYRYLRRIQSVPWPVIRRMLFADTFDIVNFSACQLHDGKLSLEAGNAGLAITYLATKNVYLNTNYLEVEDDQLVSLEKHAVLDLGGVFELKPHSVPSTHERRRKQFDRMTSRIFFEELSVSNYENQLGDIRQHLIKAGRKIHKDNFEKKASQIATSTVYGEIAGYDLFLI